MCVFRAYGKTFDVDAFVAKSVMPISGVSYRGEPLFPGMKFASWMRKFPRVKRFSGFVVPVSNRSWSNLNAQIKDAKRFLEKHSRELKRLRRMTGLDDVCLDFPLDQRIGRNNLATQHDSLPADLLLAAGKLGIGITLSIYPTGKGSSNECALDKPRKRARKKKV